MQSHDQEDIINLLHNFPNFSDIINKAIISYSKLTNDEVLIIDILLKYQKQIYKNNKRMYKDRYNREDPFLFWFNYLASC